MLFKEINSALANRFSPKIYALNGDEYGLQYGEIKPNKQIKRILLTMDLNIESIHFGLKNKINLIISRNGLINEPIKNFKGEMIKKLGLLSKYPVSIFVLNSSFIAAEGGVSDTMMELLYCQLDKPFNFQDQNNKNIPIGRICHPNFYLNNLIDIKLEEILNRIYSNLNIKGVRYIGHLNSKINKICIIGGEIPDFIPVQNLTESGCNCIISGSLNRKLKNIALDYNISVIQISLHSIENIALRKLRNYLSLDFPYDDFFFFEIEDPVQTYIKNDKFIS